ncbi:hemagglutinin repeat-containing protein [uncultured Rhodoferax sp.]|uniref:hemagglutinin repeat-containing protein n=1 Tax=uncultured Rhodoferax sp. TaxID=223188 RepID=UPI0025F084A6|nr:hemagglutinin repeat-containing protein [uncultured Rhodoferax sp.]
MSLGNDDTASYQAHSFQLNVGSTLGSGSAGNYTSKSQDIGTTLQSAGNTTLTAGQDISARAADVQAQTRLNVSAGNNVRLEAG